MTPRHEAFPKEAAEDARQFTSRWLGDRMIPWVHERKPSARPHGPTTCASKGIQNASPSAEVEGLQPGSRVLSDEQGNFHQRGLHSGIEHRTARCRLSAPLFG